MSVFTLLMKNYVNMKSFGEKSENQDKLIQSGTPGRHTKNRDSWNVCPYQYSLINIPYKTLLLTNILK